MNKTTNVGTVITLKGYATIHKIRRFVKSRKFRHFTFVTACCTNREFFKPGDLRIVEMKLQIAALLLLDFLATEAILPTSYIPHSVGNLICYRRELLTINE
jgi:hypothetical protein